MENENLDLGSMLSLTGGEGEGASVSMLRTS